MIESQEANHIGSWKTRQNQLLSPQNKPHEFVIKDGLQMKLAAWDVTPWLQWSVDKLLESHSLAPDPGPREDIE